MKFSVKEARILLAAAEVFFGEFEEEDDESNRQWNQTLNLNDTWGWACADGHYVPDEDLPEVARLFWQYGYCGILYWVSEERGGMKSEFHDINRFIEFVRQEEAIRAEEPNSSKRAYLQRSYTIGESRQ